MLTVDVLCWVPCPWPLHQVALRKTAVDMLERVGITEAEIEIILCHDATMAAANLHFMGCQGPTNVVSFPKCHEWQKPDVAHSPTLTGSLLISIGTLRREAMLYGTSVYMHTVSLMAHGMGHLAGYEHGSAMQDFMTQCLGNDDISLRHFV